MSDFMKNFKLIVFLTLPFLLLSCSKNNDAEELPEERALPIELSKRIVWVDNSHTKDSVDILQGNGDYKIILYNEFMPVNDEFKDIPFETHTKIYIENNKIKAERILPLEGLHMCMYYVLTDTKGMKKTLLIGDLITGDIDMLHD